MYINKLGNPKIRRNKNHNILRKNTIFNEHPVGYMNFSRESTL